MKIKKFISIIVFMLCIVTFFMPQIHASENENLIVNAAWLNGEMLQIDVTNSETGINQRLELRLGDYTNTEDSEYITVHAIDHEGNTSKPFRIQNPYYNPEMLKGENEETLVPVWENAETLIPGGYRPFTPSGTGEVMDNATNGDGKEFFTITTENDNTFHLIIDRQRNSENVYLLNAVTEQDLMALAESGNGNRNTSSSIPSLLPTSPPVPTPEPTVSEQTTQTQDESKSNNGINFAVIAVMLLAGGVGYYLKIYKPKQEGRQQFGRFRRIRRYGF